MCYVDETYNEQQAMAHQRVRAEVYGDACRVLADLIGEKLPTDSDAGVVDDWTDAKGIIDKGYVRGESQLTKLAKDHPEIRRAANVQDRDRLGNPRLQWVYHKARVYEHVEGRADATGK